MLKHVGLTLGRAEHVESYMQLDSFFKPKNIAVIGASRSPVKLGYELVKNLKRYKGGKVYQVNPHMKYKIVSDIKDEVDLAVIIVRAEIVPQVVKECGVKGIKNVIILSAGFKEAGRPDLQNKILEYATEYNMKIIGPNTNGLYDAYTGLECMYMPKGRLLRPKAGPISLISQSGTVGIWFLEWAAMNNLGISKFIGYGNRCEVKEYELIDYLNSDPNTKVIGVYMEGGIDGEEIYGAIKRCHKPIVIFRCGNEWSERGNRAVFNHIGCNLGRFQLDVKKSCVTLGAIMVDTIEEFWGALKALAMQPTALGKNVMMITNGAGPCVMIVNMNTLAGLEDINFQILDLVGSSTVEDYEIFLECAEGDLAVVYINWVIWNEKDDENMLKALSKFRKPIICMMYGNPKVQELSRRIEKMGIPVFSTPQEAASAIVALCR